MPERTEMIRQRIENALTPDVIEIIDESHLHAGHAGAASGGGHFNVTIVSDQFKGKSTIERHRMVYLAVDDLMRTEIHALGIKALTPEETGR